MSQSITVPAGRSILVRLTNNRKAVREFSGETILDVNEAGNWIHGFEIVGGFVPFSVERATRPFHPKLPDASRIHRRKEAVTYDSEADAAFFYLAYDPAFASTSSSEWRRLMTVAQGLSTTAVYALDADGGLVSLNIPTADFIGNIEQFLKLMKK